MQTAVPNEIRNLLHQMELARDFKLSTEAELRRTLDRLQHVNRDLEHLENRRCLITGPRLSPVVAETVSSADSSLVDITEQMVGDTVPHYVVDDNSSSEGSPPPLVDASDSSGHEGQDFVSRKRRRESSDFSYPSVASARSINVEIFSELIRELGISGAKWNELRKVQTDMLESVEGVCGVVHLVEEGLKELRDMIYAADE